MKYALPFLLTLVCFSCSSQKEEETKTKLVVGLIVDQMRFELLERFDTIFGDGGFKRLKREGYEFRNCRYNHAQTLTAPGHATIAAGAPPSVHGIAANSWFDKTQNKKVYAVYDPGHYLITNDGIDSSRTYSPANLNSETIGDAFKKAFGAQSKVVGISAKNRAAILSAGRKADMALWLDDDAYWATTTYYDDLLPQWVLRWNDKGALRKYENSVWKPLLEYYPGTSEKELGFERTFIGEPYPGFPKDFSVTVPKNGYGKLLVSPFLNKEIMEFGKEAISEMELGSDEIPDYLAISISGTDKIGHAYGPHSEETADAYVRLDREIEEFLDFLDSAIGKDSYLLFVTGDHGIANIPGRIDSVNNGGGRVPQKKNFDSINSVLHASYGDSNLIMFYYDEQLWLDFELMESKGYDIEKVVGEVKEFYQNDPGILEVSQPSKGPSGGEYDELILEGYVPRRSGDLFTVYEPGFVEDWRTGVDHGSPHDYDRHVPLVWFGKNVNQGKNAEQVIIPDIAVTLCNVLGIAPPKEATGRSLKEFFYSE